MPINGWIGNIDINEIMEVKHLDIEIDDIFPSDCIKTEDTNFRHPPLRKFKAEPGDLVENGYGERFIVRRPNGGDFFISDKGHNQCEAYVDSSEYYFNLER